LNDPRDKLPDADSQLGGLYDFDLSHCHENPRNIAFPGDRSAPVCRISRRSLQNAGEFRPIACQLVPDAPLGATHFQNLQPWDTEARKRPVGLLLRAMDNIYGNAGTQLTAPRAGSLLDA
jgi:hypothetical protein